MAVPKWFKWLLDAGGQYVVGAGLAALMAAAPTLGAFLEGVRGPWLYVGIGATAGGILAVIFGLIISAISKNRHASHEMPAVTVSKTSLRLQFGTANDLPLEIGKANIERWYVLLPHFSINDEHGTQIGQWRQAIIFLLFESPIGIRQFRITSEARLPPYEVKDSSERHAIILFNGDLSGIIVDIEIMHSR